jgi:hypothetical protein
MQTVSSPLISVRSRKIRPVLATWVLEESTRTLAANLTLTLPKEENAIPAAALRGIREVAAGEHAAAE